MVLFACSRDSQSSDIVAKPHGLYGIEMKRILLVVAFFLLLGAGFTLLSSPRSSELALRHLSAGDVVGYEHDTGIFAWLGIPFASPPVGDLRWRAPRPVKPWGGALEALSHSSMCSQLLPFAWLKPRIVFGDEDCLYLNVWSPGLSPEQLAVAKLPVMVWIHGGANTLGGSSPADPYRFAVRENVIVVSIQYRLGILGWFSHPALRNTAPEELDESSNFALLDMVAALQWVQQDISQFGGDPENVTIFGQSAGAFDVIALLATPQASGLFHKAIAQSGTLNSIPQARAENYIDDPQPGLSYSFREFINKLFVTDELSRGREGARQLQDGMEDQELVDYLQNKSPKELFASVDRRGSLGYTTPTNIRDGIVLPRESLFEIFSDPSKYNSVPIILGSNRDEYKFFLSSSPRFIDKYLGLFPRIKDSKDYNRIASYFSDQWQAVGVNEPARVLSRSQPGKVYAYRFDWSEQPARWGSPMADLYGAAHGIEVVFLFGPDAVSTLPRYARASDQPSWDELSDTMVTYWANFARSGIPSGGEEPGAVQWAPWEERVGGKIVFDSTRSGGVRMTAEAVYIADIKKRLKEDTAIETERERCELYVQLLYYALSSDFWDEKEYADFGCVEYPRKDFSGII
ncbi:MAG: para-nitrobenzyl esterase [Halieaceae bacterium]|jgi:para-nitrobenzyl esterase